MTTSYTSHFRLPIPDFNSEPWHATLETSIRAVDTALYEALLVQSVADWTNSTVYAISSIVLDSVTGLLWTCGVAHTSATSPTTFATDRTNHPTYWNTIANIPQQRGAWITATSYTAGDFVIESNRYAVCLVSHVSGTFNTDVSTGKWSILIDLSTLIAGMNFEAEDSIASAATTNIGSKTATRLLVTGTTGITSFGVVANQLKLVRYQGILTITYNATTLILFGAANRITAVGDIQWLSSDSTGNWRELMYNRADGSPVSVPDGTESAKGSVQLATDAETAAGVLTTKASHPHGVKAYADTAVAAGLAAIRNGVSASLDTLAEIATALGLLAPKASPSISGTATFSDTVAPLALSGGTTVQRSGTPSGGDVRYNTSFKSLEYWDTVNWIQLRGATQSEMEGASDVTVNVTPGRQQYHPGMAKWWLKAVVTGGVPAISASYNVTSITDVGQGQLGVTIGTDFSSADWVCLVCVQSTAGAAKWGMITTTAQTAGTIELWAAVSTTLGGDPATWHAVGYGDQ